MDSPGGRSAPARCEIEFTIVVRHDLILAGSARGCSRLAPERGGVTMITKLWTGTTAATLSMCLALNAASAPSDYAAVDLKQGWTGPTLSQWYGLSQGSRMLPMSWFRALERPDGAGLFADPSHMAAFRYLKKPDAFDDGLPVGFVADRTPPRDLAPPSAAHSTNVTWMAGQAPDEPWVGLNCSACHTAKLTYSHDGHQDVLWVHGGPTLADFQSFVDTLNAALRRTSAQAEVFDRFAGRVLAGRDTPQNRDLLKTALGHVIGRQTDMERMDALPAGYHYGFGRLDAFGNIFNRLSLEVGAAFPNANPADAPVSYPYLWNVPQQSLVQWNGIAKSSPAPFGALTRNTGEALGVFSDFTARPRGWFFWNLHGYSSSVKVDNLGTLETALKTLKPPAWPSEVFDGPEARDPGHAKIHANGRQLFLKRCSGCHAPTDRDDLKTDVKNRIFLLSAADSPNTDPWMACNSLSYQAKTGVLQGTSATFVFGPRMTAETPVVNLLQSTVVGSLWHQGRAVLTLFIHEIFGPSRPAVGRRRPQLIELSPAAARLNRLNTCLASKDPHMGYKARPLNGIWATAPYLHNGSAPTLAELLLPPAERKPVFYVGTREFDPVNVGFVTEPGPDNSFRFDTTIDGNSNSGHDYGNATFTPDDRKALIEYLKTL